MKELKNYEYKVVRANGKMIDSYKYYISEEKAKALVEKSNKRGWGWKMEKCTEEEMEWFVLINAWAVGAL